MNVSFKNDSTRLWLARTGPAKIFGKDVDKREAMSDVEAVDWFNRVWESTLCHAVGNARQCDVTFVRDKVKGQARNFIDSDASHREFTLSNCQFICQLPDRKTCDQLWFIPSTSGDPRTDYVKFESIPIKESFDRVSRSLGWEKPEELAEKLLLDFVETVERNDVNERDNSQVEPPQIDKTG